MRRVFWERREKAYEERVSDNPGRSGGTEHKEGANTLIAVGRRHRKVSRADVPVPPTERDGDIHIGVAG